MTRLVEIADTIENLFRSHGHTFDDLEDAVLRAGVESQSDVVRLAAATLLDVVHGNQLRAVTGSAELLTILLRVEALAEELDEAVPA